MKTFLAIILLIIAMNILSGCAMKKDGLYGQGHHEGGTESNRGYEPGNRHRH
jgi:hypothetical protein